MNHQVVPAGETEIWTDRIQVPPLPPSFLMGCSIIDINYNLEVKKKNPCITHVVFFCDNKNYYCFTVKQN